MSSNTARGLSACMTWMAYCSLSTLRPHDLLGYEPHEVIGKKISLVLAPAMRPLFAAYLERIRSQPTDSGLMRVITKHGQERIWVLSQHPV